MRIKANPRVNPAGVSQANFQTQVLSDAPNPLLSAAGDIAGVVAQQAPAFAQMNQIQGTINDQKRDNDLRERLKREQQMYKDGLNESSAYMSSDEKRQVMQKTEMQIAEMWKESPYSDQFQEQVWDNRDSRKLTTNAYLMKAEQQEAINTAELQMLDLSTSSLPLEQKIQRSDEIADGLSRFYPKEKIDLMKAENKVNLTISQAKFVAETSIPQPQEEDVNGAEAYQTYKDQLIRGTKQVATFLKDNGSNIPQEMRQKMAIQAQRRAVTNAKQAENAYNLSYNNALKQRLNDIKVRTQEDIGFTQLLGEPIPDQSSENQEFATWWNKPEMEQYLDQIVRNETISEIDREVKTIMALHRQRLLQGKDVQKIINEQEQIFKYSANKMTLDSANDLVSTTQRYKENKYTEAEKLTKDLFTSYVQNGRFGNVPTDKESSDYIEEHGYNGYQKWMKTNYYKYTLASELYDQWLQNPAYNNVTNNEQAVEFILRLETELKGKTISIQDSEATNSRVKQERIDNWGNWEFGN